MSYDWLETLLMGVIFLSAALFAIKHFVPRVYESAKHPFLRKKAGGMNVMEISKTSGNDCATKCSTCNGCSQANKP